MAIIVAVTGKGGTGKTILSTLMVRILGIERGRRVLAIDADSAVSLAYALGADGVKTLSDIRNDIIEDPAARKTMLDNHIRDIVAELICHGNGFDLLVMGRPEGPGCFCSINDLLRYGIETLSDDYDIAIIDGEAGPEQINRRVMRGIDYLAILTDTSARGIRTAGVVGAVAAKGGTADLKKSGLVINRIREDRQQAVDAARNLGQDILGIIPEDPYITKYDLTGTPILDLPESAESLDAVRNIVVNMGF